MAGLAVKHLQMFASVSLTVALFTCTAGNVPNLLKEDGVELCVEAVTTAESNRQAYLALAALEAMIANDNTRVVRRHAINDRVFFRALHNMYRNREDMAGQILYCVRILGRIAEECPVYLPCTAQDKHIVEKVRGGWASGCVCVPVSVPVSVCLCVCVCGPQMRFGGCVLCRFCFGKPTRSTFSFCKSSRRRRWWARRLCVWRDGAGAVTPVYLYNVECVQMCV